MEFPEFNGPDEGKGKGDLAFQLILNNQAERFRFCLETGILAKDQLIWDENILGRIVREIRLDLLKVAAKHSSFRGSWDPTIFYQYLKKNSTENAIKSHEDKIQFGTNFRRFF